MTEGTAGGQGWLLTVGVSCHAQSFASNGEITCLSACWMLGLQAWDFCRGEFLCVPCALLRTLEAGSMCSGGQQRAGLEGSALS